MKKNKGLFLLALFALTACSVSENFSMAFKSNEIPKEKVQKLTYKVKSNRDEYYSFDFETNTAVHHFWAVTMCAPGVLACGGDPMEVNTTATFTEEQEVAFIEGIKQNGLLSLDENYLTEEEKSKEFFPWQIIFDFEGGKQKVSTGWSVEPTDVFNACSTYFYDLCKFEVLGTLPAYYKVPPYIPSTVSYESGGQLKEEKVKTFHNSFVSGREVFQLVPYRYYWNNTEHYVRDSLFELASVVNSCENNVNNFSKSTLNPQLTFDTTNYDCNRRFTEFELVSYAYCENLYNKKTILKTGWFQGQITIDLEMDRIYVYRLTFENGNYAEYTMTTLLKEREFMGNYHGKPVTSFSYTKVDTITSHTTIMSTDFTNNTYTIIEKNERNEIISNETKYYRSFESGFFLDHLEAIDFFDIANSYTNSKDEYHYNWEVKIQYDDGKSDTFSGLQDAPFTQMYLMEYYFNYYLTRFPSDEPFAED